MSSFLGVMIAIALLSHFGWGRRRSPEDARRLRELEQTIVARDEELDRLHERMAEVEARLDFAERLLAKGNDP